MKIKMNRLKNLIKTNELEGKRIIVTGCSYKPIEHVFTNLIDGDLSHDSIFVESEEMKINIGTATAFSLAAKGATIHMVSRSIERLENIKKAIVETLNISPKKIEYSQVDLLDEDEVKNFVYEIKKDKPIWWYQSIGLGAGAYKVKNDNPYLHIEDIPTELLEKESQIVLRGTHILMKALLPIFKNQFEKFGCETRIVIVSSMSAVRGYALGGTHCAAKGAISRYTNAAMLDFYKKKIFVTDLRPGAIDTGMYDNEFVQKSILEIDDEYNGLWREKFRLAPPISVGESAAQIFTNSGHITSLNLVAEGQFPHEGS